MKNKYEWLFENGEFVMNKINTFLLSVDDADKTFLSLQNDELYLYIPDVKYKDIQVLKDRYQFLIDGSKSENEVWLNWIIYHDLEKKEPIGTLQATIFKDEQKAYIGYVIYRKFWNQGYGTLALNWLENCLEENEDVKILEAYVDYRNIFSKKILEKLGFEKIHEENNNYVYQKRIK
nr:GNAT family N-acetyltransferase [Acinetobacter dispersus]